MTATEQQTTGLFLHQNGRKSPTTTVSCLSSNVGSITDFLFNSSLSSSSSSTAAATAHSTLSPSTNIPSTETREEPRDEFEHGRTSCSPSPPQILIHTSSEPHLDQPQISTHSNGISVSEHREGDDRIAAMFVFSSRNRYPIMKMNHPAGAAKKS